MLDLCPKSFVPLFCLCLKQCILLQEIHELILYMLKANPMERPYIYSVIEKTHDVVSKIEVKA